MRPGHLLRHGSGRLVDPWGVFGLDRAPKEPRPVRIPPREGNGGE